jgi:hypothetical protein
MTAQQLREFESSRRIMASRVRSHQVVNLFLALSDRFQARASERELELHPVQEPETDSGG